MSPESRQLQKPERVTPGSPIMEAVSSASYSTMEKTDVVYKPSPFRWYILIIFSLSIAMAEISWNTYSPLAQSLNAIFGWNKNTYVTFTVYEQVGDIFLVFIPLILTLKHGIRAYVLYMNGMGLCSALVRCINVHNLTFITIMGHLSMILNTLATAALAASPVIIGATWFPPQEWTFATSVINSVNFLGISATYLLGPNVVPMPNGHNHDQIWNKFFNYNYAQLAVYLTITLCCIIYFPSKPIHPPSASSKQIRQINLISGSKELLCKKEFWILAFRLTFINVNYTIMGVTTVFLSTMDVDQVVAGYIAAFSIMITVVLGPVLGKVVDKLGIESAKAIILFVGIEMLIGVSWIALIQMKVLPGGNLNLIVPTALYLCGGYSLWGIQEEQAVQTLFPMSEFLVSVWMFTMWAVVGAITSAFTYLGYYWLGWYLVVTLIIGLICALLSPYHSKRMDQEN